MGVDHVVIIEAVKALEQGKRTEKELIFARQLLTARYSEDKEMQQQLENTLIKNYIDELKFLRVENYELSTKLTESEDECKVLQNRLKTVKDKYTIAK